MVIDIAESRMTASELVHQAVLEFNEFCNNVCLDFVSEQYEYLQENGIAMELNEAENGFMSRVGKIISKAVTTVRTLVSNLVEKLNNKIAEIKDSRKAAKAKAIEKQFESEANASVDEMEDTMKKASQSGNINDFSDRSKSTVNKTASKVNNMYRNCCTRVANGVFEMKPGTYAVH